MVQELTQEQRADKRKRRARNLEITLKITDLLDTECSPCTKVTATKTDDSPCKLCKHGIAIRKLGVELEKKDNENTVKEIPDELLKAMAENKLTKTLVKRRVSKGMTLEQACTTPKGTTREPTVIDGIAVTAEMVATAKSNGIPRPTLLNRLKAGVGVEEAVTKPTQQKLLSRS